MPQRTKTKT